MTDPRAAEILDIVAKETGVARTELGADVPMDTLGIASLDLVQTIFALETHYGIELPVAGNEDGAEFRTVGDLVTHVIATIDAKQVGDATGGAEVAQGAGTARIAGSA